MAALSEYVDFSSIGWTANVAPIVAPTAASLSDGSDTGLRKGMLRSEAERRFGPGQQMSDRREGNLTVTTVVFMRGDERIMVDFIEDVLVRYTISSR